MSKTAKFAPQKKQNMISSKRHIEDAYAELINRLESFSQQISSINGINSGFDAIQDKFIEEIKHKIEDAKLQLSDFKDKTVWDNLVIAFFGETNAGKSTIIETFRILFDEKSPTSLTTSTTRSIS